MLVIKWPILGFIIGALSASISPMWLLLISPVLLLWVIFTRPSLMWSMIAFVLGCVWVNWHWDQIHREALPESVGKTEQLVLGEISQLVEHSYKTEFDFLPVHERYKLKVSCYRCRIKFTDGEVWQLDLRMKPIHSFQNPYGFNYRQWMMAKGYGAQAYVNQKSGMHQLLEPVSHRNPNLLSQLLDSTQFPILRALVLGDKAALEVEQSRLIRSLGLSHLFVVSGLHVGIVAGLFGLLVFWLQRPLLLMGWPYSREFSILSGVVCAIYYGHLTGFEVPAIRAVLMLCCAAVILLRMRYLQVVHYYFLTLFLVLIAKPLAFMDMGSWLSFSIVFALILGFSNTTKLSWVKGVIKAQWLAFLMGGIVLIGFNQFIAPFSFVLNLCLIPIFSLLVLPLTVLAIFLSVISDTGLLLVIESGLDALLLYLQTAHAWMSWYLPIHAENRWLVMMGLLLLILPIAFRMRLLAFGVLITALLLPFKSPEYGGFKLTILDVGQGSSGLIQTKNHTLLVDTGAQFLSGLTLADLVVIPYLRTQNIRSINRLHISHNDNDHNGGLALFTSMATSLVQQSSCETEQWQWDGVLFEQFQAAGFTTGNNGSCLLRVSSSNGQQVLFTGDIEKEAELALVDEMPEKLRADVMISPHHGSQTSSTDSFLDAVMADKVIISAGFLNHYGHPHEQTLNRYAIRKMMILTTAENGAVQVEFPPRQAALVVSTYRPNLSFIE